MCGHMLQTTKFAAEEGPPPSLLVAALLHDIGYFGTGYSLDFDHESHATRQLASRDREHEEAGPLIYMVGAEGFEPTPR